MSVRLTGSTPHVPPCVRSLLFFSVPPLGFMVQPCRRFCSIRNVLVEFDDNDRPFCRFQYVLAAATSIATKMTEESLTYLNQGQPYEIKMKKLGDLSNFRGKLLRVRGPNPIIDLSCLVPRLGRVEAERETVPLSVTLIGCWLKPK